MKRKFQALMTLLMALTLNALMVFASTGHAATHHAETTIAQPCDHHGHGLKKSGHVSELAVNDCAQQLCPSCMGLPLSLAAELGFATSRIAALPRLTQGSQSWQPPLFRPPIHI
ncbi:MULTISPECIES: hypothetical protein [Devosia]|uniref:hypothetical protein n=1 Tax=Devosia TaxID=46913 RepID=UPI0013001922|nr:MULTISPECIES: hypothetical protein [Devosia]